MSDGTECPLIGTFLTESESSEDELPIELEDDELQRRLEKAARAIKDCDALLITTGAGHGHDGGLPTFRGKDGMCLARKNRVPEVN